MPSWLPQRRDVVSFAVVFGLLGAVYLLPPDTALRQVQAAGTLRVCMPASYPPLVTGDPAAPGIDVEMLRLIAEKLDLHLATVANPAMGQDFNPRSWRVTRAQCEILAGGVVGSPTTRSFLDTTQAYATTGWAWVSPQPDGPLQGRRVGVLVGVSGLDRVALASWLRAAKAQVTITADTAEMVNGLRNGRFDVAITERLLAAELAAAQGWHSGWMPAELGRYPLVLGLWKGDLTLKRAIGSALQQAQECGSIAKIIAHYVPDRDLADRPDAAHLSVEDSVADDSLGRRK
jgi:ABC-type amino acid transport substrate-binding protein